MATTQTFSIRPGCRADLPHAVEVFLSAFRKDDLFDILFPNRHTHPHVIRAQISRLYASRYWSLNYDLRVVAGNDDGRIVGLTWWKRPKAAMSFWERWVSPYAWIAPLISTWFSIRDWLFPIKDLDKYAGDTFVRAFATVEPALINTPRREKAWYLSTLAVDPTVQSKGLGTMLLRDGLERVDQEGNAAWLIALETVEEYYKKHGFREVGRANVGELQDWTGGAIMFRNDE
ncbi:acyl-CoA N-acyltransferase [Emericellopsis atlantica]|uniref:Acyl-CoA N-acyltransferase n=1 Tax=Emericellopsis atlantica TaxID=2614577 RepID=A0A9P7ZMV7_9HYPO|nr:acyl-CoA N-acyltransferase [Emericellopsis atlantica]KAG9254627.1 acyl-CoA N-acyltransferase [Emericellopsis atlantica]